MIGSYKEPPKILFLQISSKDDPNLVTVVFKKSTVEEVKEYARKLWELNPTAYYISINDGQRDLFATKIMGNFDQHEHFFKDERVKPKKQKGDKQQLSIDSI